MRSANEKKMFELLLDEVETTLQDIEKRCLTLEKSDQEKELQVIFRAAHNVKGAAQLYSLVEFGACVHALEDLLSTLQKVQKESGKRISNQTIDIMLFAQGFLWDWVQSLRQDDKYIADATMVKAIISGHIEDLKNGKITFGETRSASETAETSSQSPHSAPPQDGASLQIAPPSTASSAAGSKGKTKRSGTLRVPSEKLDEIMQLIGELSIHQGILWHNYHNNTFNILTCKNAVVLNQKTLKDLYDLVLTLRMQSADTLFQRIERTARDIAKDQGKKVAIELIGSDTPLDKTVIELITDPMIHMVRNAIDHGIETEKDRKAAGKNPTARLTIQTQQDLGQVIITISDDGRGMDPQYIYEKAVKKGLIDAGKKMSDQDILQLIYLPGFSTRDTISEISGRGVGMDIVQKAIQQLGGRIDTQSKKGQGTTFQILLPATLEIIEGLRVRVCGSIYIIPRQEVAEIIDLEEFGVESIGKGQAFKLREHVVPIEDLADYIGFEHTGADANARSVALVVKLPDRSKLALRVDAVLGQQQIVVRPLSDQLAKVPGFTGVTILGNGEPAMIVSPGLIAEYYMKWIGRDGRAA